LRGCVEQSSHNFVARYESRRAQHSQEPKRPRYGQTAITETNLYQSREYDDPIENIEAVIDVA
jgi:hypothetical protein